MNLPETHIVVNLRPIRTEVFVHLNLRTVDPCNRVGQLSILICVPVMSPYSRFGILAIREPSRLDALGR